MCSGENERKNEIKKERGRKRVSRQDKAMLQGARKTLNDHKGKQKSRSCQIVDRLATHDKLFNSAHLLCATLEHYLVNAAWERSIFKGVQVLNTRKVKRIYRISYKST